MSLPPASTAPTRMRQVFCVLSARSLPYARRAMESLLHRVDEPVDLHLVTDGDADRDALVAAMADIRPPAMHAWQVHTQADIDPLAEDQFARHPNLRAFRRGHPCWRKITDPYLLAGPGEEMVILDPDLYFPNRFRFEPTPDRGLLLMWQRPSCLFPDEVVRTAYAAGIALAHHVDIGVGHARKDWDLDWLDDLVGRLGGAALPRSMHVEAIVWAAMAMREGGGHLSPRHWKCWHNAQWKRVALKLGVSGATLLEVEPFQAIKCFHGGGAAKWWIEESLRRHPERRPSDLTDRFEPALPYVPLTERAYDDGQRLKRAARRLGYYRLFGA